jgi:hypothetical protein
MGGALVEHMDQDNKPHVVAVNLAEHTVMHLQALIDHGALEGPRGEKKINPKLRPLIDAMYNVLAGGEAEVNITIPGARGVIDELKKKEIPCIMAINEINGRYGFGLVMEV